nr:hypothetical protein [Armatimonadota bacterium]NIO95878.1 hypothetical protein [Armatimonadota bacterium]
EIFRTYDVRADLEIDPVTYSVYGVHITSIKLEGVEIPMSREFIVMLEEAALEKYEEGK